MAKVKLSREPPSPRSTTYESTSKWLIVSFHAVGTIDDISIGAISVQFCLFPGGEEKKKELGGRISAQDKTTVCESSAKIYSNLFLVKHGRLIKFSKLFKHLLCWDHMSFPNLCSLFLVDPI